LRVPRAASWRAGPELASLSRRGNYAIDARAARSAGGFVFFEGWLLGLIRLLDSFNRLVLLRRNFPLDLDGVDLDELSRLVDAFIVGIAPSALPEGSRWVARIKGAWPFSGGSLRKTRHNRATRGTIDWSLDAIALLNRLQSSWISN